MFDYAIEFKYYFYDALVLTDLCIILPALFIVSTSISETISNIDSKLKRKANLRHKTKLDTKRKKRKNPYIQLNK